MKSAPQEPAARIGRRIGIALFWMMAVFVIGASTRSVVAQLYGTGAGAVMDGSAGEANGSAGEAECARELHNLKHGLLQRAGAELGLPHDPTRTRQWLVGWDKRHALLEGRCGSLEPTWRALFTLRTKLEARLHQHAREHQTLIDGIDRSLDRFDLRSSPSPKEI